MTLDKVIAIDTTVEIGVETLISASRESLKKYPDLSIILVGNPDDPHLKNLEGRLSLRESTTIIRGRDSLRDIAKKIRKSSIYETARLVGGGEAHAGISFGDTRGVAISVAKNLELLENVKRPPLAVRLPCFKGGKLSSYIFLDVGVTPSDDCTPETLLKFAILGGHYARQEGIKTQRIGLFSNGKEPTKGTKLLKKADELFEAYASLNPFDYIGFVEGTEMYMGGESKPDIVVTDGFTGNVVLKSTESLARLFEAVFRASFESNLRTKTVGYAAKQLGIFDEIRNTLHPDQYGGASVLGLEGIFIKGHGASSERAIITAIDLAYRSVENRSDCGMERELNDLSTFLASN